GLAGAGRHGCDGYARGGRGQRTAPLQALGSGQVAVGAARCGGHRAHPVIGVFEDRGRGVREFLPLVTDRSFCNTVRRYPYSEERTVRCPKYWRATHRDRGSPRWTRERPWPTPTPAKRWPACRATDPTSRG